MPCSIKKSENVIIKNTLLALEHSEYFFSLYEEQSSFLYFCHPLFWHVISLLHHIQFI